MSDTQTVPLHEQNTHLHRLDESNQAKRPEAAEKGEQGESEVVFSWRAGLRLQRDKVLKSLNLIQLALYQRNK